ncbi:discoidin domain-containing protein [Streptomyces sp. 110]|uniref:Discoidin domain-containing protein n=1 Tax=Streptomyces endocoffeicus TaxID=2898945 RepID=A0ABS1Q561_9ACTN|nr:discoidin domain-containing protein [Streptomyces endocoffeicus]MBL1119699.1 discoidin domain-containing protein [Streptomyces endocoffeicus]
MRPVAFEEAGAAGTTPDPWLMRADAPDDSYDAHPYVGNGYLAQRIPAKGMGYFSSGGPTGWPLSTKRYDGAYAAGLFAKQGDAEFLAALPTWSTLDFATDAAGGENYASAANNTLTSYRQELDVRRGLVTTRTSWCSASGRTTDLSYEVLADRSRAHVGAVRLKVTPRWSGTASVTDLLDGNGARRLEGTGADVDTGTGTSQVSFATAGNGIAGTLASRLTHSGDVQPTSSKEVAADKLSAGQRLAFPVRAGHTYEFTKFVGLDTAQTSKDPKADALRAASDAARTGWTKTLAEHTDAWAKLWEAGVGTPGQERMQSWINGSYYSLFSSLREGQDWSLAPSGLSSDTYAGLVFWDAETWMFPGLLTTHPELAKSVVDYRYRTLEQAKKNAAGGNLKGALYAWTSAATGNCSNFHACYNYQAHLQSDIALSQWQYFQATGDKKWLKSKGWPVIEALAEFWASRVSKNSDGSYSVRNVAGADEYSHGDDNVSTNAGAATTLRLATEAAALVGAEAPAQWTTIADRLRIPLNAVTGTHPEYEGYNGHKVKQADTVLMQHPTNWPMPKNVARNDLNYYAARTDPEGPAMTDSVHMIAAANLGDDGCTDYTYLLRSVRPFIREPYAQFSEARGEKAGDNAGAPAFTFLTGAGGFLQTYPYGLAGLRWKTNSLHLDPTLPPQLANGVRINRLKWQGRELSLEVGPKTTTVRLLKGEPARLDTPAGNKALAKGEPVRLDTRRPDLAPSGNVARCKNATASSSDSGYYPAAAVDGNPVTAWAATGSQADLTVDLKQRTRIAEATVARSGTSSFGYKIQTSADGKTWTTLATQPAGTGTDHIRFLATTTRHIRLDFPGSEGAATPQIAEFSVAGGKDAGQVRADAEQSYLSAGEQGTVTTTYTNHSSRPVRDVRLGLETPKAWQPTAKSPTSFSQVDAGKTVKVTWQITAPQGTPSSAQFTAKATHQRGQQTVTDTAPAGVSLVEACAPDKTCEAEDASFFGSAKKAGDHAGYSGEGFVAGLNRTGAGITTYVKVPATGTYTIGLRYANSVGGAVPPYEAKTRTMTLDVLGDDPKRLSFEVTKDWDTWATHQVRVRLEKGTQPLVLNCTAQDDCSINLDALTLSVSPEDHARPERN